MVHAPGGSKIARQKERPIKRLWLIATIALVLGLAPSPASAGLPAGAEVKTLKSGLEFPVDMSWERGSKRIFFTEQDTGKIRVMKGRTLLAEPCRDLDVGTVAEQGALGITLHPDFAENKYLYVYYTNRAPRENRVARFVVNNNKCTDKTIVVKDIPANQTHNGGQLKFVGDKLFVTTGDAGEPDNAQDVTLDLDPEATEESSLAGKVLRYNDDGTIPADNPYVGDLTKNPAIWSYGHRNGFGLAHRGGTEQVFQTENGPGCDDEVNFIEPDTNYGWPPTDMSNCTGYAPGTREPLAQWDDTIAPTDAHWYDGRLDAFDEGLYFGDFKFGQIHFLQINAAGTEVLNGPQGEVVYNGPDPIIDVTKGPGGWFYFLTDSAIKKIVDAP